MNNKDIYTVPRLFFISPLILQTIIWPITRPVLSFFMRLNISGIDNLKNLKRGVVFVCNHSSELDAIVIPASLPFLHHLMPMFYTSREKSFYCNSGWRQIIYGGFFFKIWGAHPLNAGKKNYDESLKNHEALIKGNATVLIFPEGHKTKDGNLDIFHGGAFYLANKMNVPIVPICIKGLYDYKFTDFILRKRKITVKYNKPMVVREFLGENPNIDDIKSFAERVRGMMNAMLSD